MKHGTWIWILLVATVAQAQPSKRSHVEKKLAEALLDIKLCGKQFACTSARSASLG